MGLFARLYGISSILFAAQRVRDVTAAIIHALKMWRNYLMGKKFLLNIDSMSLKYLFDQQDLNARKEYVWPSLVSTIFS